MPSHKSTAKSLRQNVKRQERNVSTKSHLRTLMKQVQQLVKDNNPDQADIKLRSVVSVLDTAAKKNVIHPRNAARRKSRLTRLVNTLKSPS